MAIITPENQNGASLPIVSLLPSATVAHAFTGASSATAALPAGVYILNPSQTCFINWNGAADAAGSGFRLSADSMFAVMFPGGTINVLSAGTNGTLYVTPLESV